MANTDEYKLPFSGETIHKILTSSNAILTAEEDLLEDEKLTEDEKERIRTNLGIDDLVEAAISGKADEEHKHTLSDITDYEVPEIPTKVSQLQNDSDFITREEVPETDLSEYAKKSEIPDVSGFISEIPSEYITESELNDKGYLTEHQDLGEYAKKTDLPTVPTNVSQLSNDSEYVTKTELDNKGYLTQHQSLDSYAKKEELFSKDYNDLTNTPTIPSIDGLTSDVATVKEEINKIKDGPTTVANAAKLNNLPVNWFRGNNTNFIYQHYCESDINNLVAEGHYFVWALAHAPSTFRGYGFVDVSYFNGIGFAPHAQGETPTIRQTITEFFDGTTYVRIGYKDNTTDDAIEWREWHELPSLDALKNGGEAYKVGSASIADYASADTSKGTIEERLTRLGFREGTVTALNGGTVSSPTRIKRQGNYVIGKIYITYPTSATTGMNFDVCNIPSDFAPSETQSMRAIVMLNNRAQKIWNANITADSQVYLANIDPGETIYSIEIQLGYEAAPLY